MKTVTITIFGRDYNVACDEGEEAQLFSLARHLDDCMHGLAQHAQHASESLLLVLTGLMLADELQDARREVHEVRQEIRELRSEIFHTSQSVEDNKAVSLDTAVASTISDIAARIERIAQAIESEYAT